MPAVTGIPSADRKTYAMERYSGFTHTLGMSGINPPLFAHEFAHSFYNSPHYLMANSVTGPHFYATEGPGMMGYIRTFFAANAWERWFNGWVELKTGANGTPTDIRGPASLTATNGLYTLRDYVTTGDVMRILIPGTQQHVWLENHQGKSVFDDRIDFLRNGLNQLFRTAPRGILAMVENMSNSRDSPLNFEVARGANGLKVLSAQGNFDYQAVAGSAAPNPYLFGNKVYNFTTTANPFGGENQISRHLIDDNQDGTLRINSSVGNRDGDPSEMVLSALVSNTYEDGLLGPDVTFNTVGQKMGNSYNPAIFGQQTHINYFGNDRLTAIDLNGLSVEVVGKNANGDITVKVRYDDVAIVRNTRWSGELNLTDVPGTTGGYDLTVSPNVILTLDKSGTPNRSTKTSANDFINPTKLTLVPNSSAEVGTGAQLLVRGAGTTLTLEVGSTLMTRPSSQLSIGAGSLLELRDGSRLTVKGTLPVAAGGTLLVRSGATLFIEGAASIPSGAYICLEQGGSIVRSSSTNGTLTVESGAIQGTNPALGLTTQACGPPTTTCSPLFITGTYRSLDYPGGRVSTLTQSNFADPGTYEVTLNPATAVFEPWYFDANYAASAYNTDNNRRAEITVNVNGQVSVSVQGTNCSTGSLSFNFNSNVITNVAPNPTSDELRIEATAPDGQTQTATATEAPSFEVSLHNAYGQAVRTAKSQKGKIKLVVRELPAGLYTLRTFTGTGAGQRVVSEHIQITH